jgi:hypothetical protein
MTTGADGNNEISNDTTEQNLCYWVITAIFCGDSANLPVSIRVASPDLRRSLELYSELMALQLISSLTITIA